MRSANSDEMADVLSSSAEPSSSSFCLRSAKKRSSVSFIEAAIESLDPLRLSSKSSCRSVNIWARLLTFSLNEFTMSAFFCVYWFSNSRVRWVKKDARVWSFSLKELSIARALSAKELLIPAVFSLKESSKAFVRSE